MSYVESQLLPGEQVRHRAQLHRIAFLPAYAATGATIVLALLALNIGELWFVVAPLGLVAAGMLLVAFITYKSSEFAVTDRRVIIKVGWIKRRTLETMLGKVEAVGVDQGLLGRLLNFGTITVTGTGGTQEQFERIAKPLEFRKHVQAAALASESRAIPSAHDFGPREERECPFCAERILVRARICRYCGREVPPAAGD